MGINENFTCLCTLEEFVLGSLDILRFATPGSEYGGLQGMPVGEGEGPWLTARALVNGIQVDRCVLLGLTSRQEAYS